MSVDCGWCCKPIAPNAPRWRLHSSETSRFSGTTLLSLHPDCGEEWMDRIPWNLDAMRPETVR